MRSYGLLSILLLAVLSPLPAGAEDYLPADALQRLPDQSTTILPEKFLRGFDPITVYFNQDRGPGRGPADKGSGWLTIEPAWPGAYFWVDRKTLQFRPAEPWPALARFAVKTKGQSRVLTTMMSAPSSMTPAAGSDGLRSFRSFTLTFPQVLPVKSLKKMLQLESYDLPGLASSRRVRIDDYHIVSLPRRSHRDAAVYALSLEHEIPEGKQLQVKASLALGEEGKVVWTGRLSTRLPFHLQALSCGGHEQSLAGRPSLPAESALSCGPHGDTPQLVFSAEPQGMSLTELKKLLRLEPAVADLSFRTYGRRVTLLGKFVPEVLYRLSVQSADLVDSDGRKLSDPGQIEAFFYLGRRQPFLRWQQASAILEAKGPRMIPLSGYGEARADLRIYRIDPLHRGLWPFPANPVLVAEESAPPFPGEEPERPAAEQDTNYVSAEELQSHLRLLGSPLYSQVVDLPLAQRGSITRFGLDIGRILDRVSGRNRPGHYLVGLRRLAGEPERAYVRLQVTNLSLTTVEERERVVFYVRSIDSAAPVGGAQIVIEAVDKPPRPLPGQARRAEKIDRVVLETDGRGRAELRPQKNWRRIHRMYVQKGEDLLVLDPRDPPPRFANNHWSPWGNWLHWITADKIPDPVNDKLMAFVFSERPIYRPGEKVYLKGYLRRRTGGKFVSPGPAGNYRLQIEGPGGKQWSLPLRFSELAGFAAEFTESDVPTGTYQAVLSRHKPRQVLARRSFKIEAYRVPTFEVQMVGPNRVPNDGPFKVKAVARYYAGGSVSNRPIEWRVTRRAYHHVPAGRPGFLFASSAQFSRDGQPRPPESSFSAGELDKNGADEIEVNPALDMDGSARIYTIESTVTGTDNQQVSAVARCKALPPFVLGMKLRRYAERALTLRPEIIAVGVNDKLLANQKVTVRLYRRTWHSHLRETDFSTGKASYVTERQDKKILEQTVLTGKAAVRPSLPIKRAGVYVVELSARDRLGRVQTLSADLYLGGKEAVAWPKSSQGVFEISTDRKRYQPGQTARLIIKSPFQQAQAMIVVEEPKGNRYLFQQVRGGKAVQTLSIRSPHVPNLHVHVVLMRGRLGQGSQGDDRYRPQTLAASLSVAVDPVRNQVQVGIKHPETVRPGSTVPVTITLKDERERPLAGEVTLWLVDEAVLSLADEGPLNPLDSFVTANRSRTSIRDTRNKVIGRIQEEEEPAGDGEEEADEDGRLPGKRKVRKNFQTVPYYQATLKVGPSGRLTVSVKMSDDLTNFKLRAVAVSGLSRFGYRQNRLRVRLPVLVQPQLPRFVRQGDRFWVGGIGRLVEGAEGPGAVAVKIDGLLSPKSWRKKLTLKRNRAESHLFPVTARSGDPTQASQLTVRMDIVRKADQVGDAFEVKLPLLPDRQVEHFAYHTQLRAGRTELQAFPEISRPGTAVQELVVSSVPGVIELLSGLDYLAAYPHGCLEQKMSRLMPQMATGEMLRKLGLNQHYALQVAEHVRRLIAEMDVFQDDEGFFSFWPGSSGGVFLTAQAVEFLHQARRLGVEPSARMWRRAVAGLQKSLRSDFRGLRAQYRYNQQTAAIRSLTRIGKLDEHYLGDLYQHRKDMDLTSVADLSLAMSRHPRLFKTNLKQLRQDLWDGLEFKLHRGKPVYRGLQLRRSHWTGAVLGSNTSTLAAVFEGLVALDPKHERLRLIRDALLATASGAQGFGSTHNSRRAIEALAAYLLQAQDEGAAAQVSLSAGGELRLSAHTKVARILSRTDDRQKLSVKGDFPLTARVHYQYLPAAPGDQVDAQRQGFVVSRSMTLIPKDKSANSQLGDEKGKQLKLQLGDILELHTQLLSRKDRYHVALVVPFAAGLEPLNPELKTAGPEAQPEQADSIVPTYVQRLDHEVRYYFTRLPKGSHSFHFRLRATGEGSFVHPAPYAEQMYHQEVRGRGPGMRIDVCGANQKP